ncbi:uncharacterized protein LOC133915101 [Phragmites australis]|uniref:uncharacterized protein LOC133915101 n=1 Tax=Phragmites australis TaxID=29695 RepID=UPI002D76E87C|nr:uncharacterized protein LOC133915101 [Phragmites australis]
MASLGFGSTVAAVAPASSSPGRGRRPRPMVALPAATRGGQAATKEEKSLADFIFGAIFKKDQLVETDPLLNKVDGAPSAGTTVSSRAKARGGTTAGARKAAGDDDGGSGGGFNLGGLFAKKG